MQIAKEQFCQVVKEVPMISDIEIVPTGLQRGFGDFVRFFISQTVKKTMKFCIEVEARGERRFVNAFMLMASQYADDSFYILMAPYISESSAEALREKKIWL